MNYWHLEMINYILFYCVISTVCVQTDRMDIINGKQVQVENCKTEKKCPTEKFNSYEACWARFEEIMYSNNGPGSIRYAIFSCPDEMGWKK